MIDKEWILLYMLFVLAILINISCRGQSIIIKPLSPFVSITNDTIIEGRKIGTTKSNFFFIKNYRFDDKDQIKEVKKFVFKQLDNDYRKFSQYDVYFYKYTSTLNENYIETENDQLAWHNEDQLFYFSWRDGKFFSFLWFENGRAKSKLITEDSLFNIK